MGGRGAIRMPDIEAATLRVRLSDDQMTEIRGRIDEIQAMLDTQAASTAARINEPENALREIHEIADAHIMDIHQGYLAAIADIANTALEGDEEGQ